MLNFVQNSERLAVKHVLCCEDYDIEAVSKSKIFEWNAWFREH